MTTAMNCLYLRKEARIASAILSSPGDGVYRQCDCLSAIPVFIIAAYRGGLCLPLFLDGIADRCFQRLLYDVVKYLRKSV